MCLSVKGYFSPAYRGLWNAVTHHVTPRDLQGYWRDLHNINSNAQHFKEVAEAAKGVSNRIIDFIASIADPFLPPDQRTMIQVLKSASEDTIGFVTRAMDAADTHHIENDGWIPFFWDILKGSGCYDAAKT